MQRAEVLRDLREYLLNLGLNADVGPVDGHIFGASRRARLRGLIQRGDVEIDQCQPATLTRQARRHGRTQSSSATRDGDDLVV